MNDNRLNSRNLTSTSQIAHPLPNTMLDPNDSRFEESTEEIPAHVTAMFFLSLAGVVFLLRKMLLEATISHVETLKAENSYIHPTRKTSLTDIDYTNSLRKIRCNKSFKSKTSVKTFNDNRLKLKSPLEFKEQLKALFVKKNKIHNGPSSSSVKTFYPSCNHKAEKVEHHFLLHPSDFKAILPEEKIKLVKSVQNSVERILGQPISTLLPSPTDLFRYSDLYKLLSSTAISDMLDDLSIVTNGSDIDIEFKHKRETLSNFFRMHFPNEFKENCNNKPQVSRKIEETIKVLMNEAARDFKSKNSQTHLVTESCAKVSDMCKMEPEDSSDVTLSAEPNSTDAVTTPFDKHSTSTSKSRNSFTTLFKNSLTSPSCQTSTSSLEPLDMEKLVLIEDLDQVISSPEAISKASHSHMSEVNASKCNINSNSDLSEVSPREVSSAGDIRMYETQSVVMYDPLDIMNTESFVSIGFCAGDINQVPSWHR